MPAQSSASDTAAARVAAIPELVQNIFTQFVELDPANLNYTNSRNAAPSFANEYIKQGSALTLLSCRLVCHSWNTIACDVLFADADIGISLVLLEGQVSRAVLSVVGEIANEQECSHRLRQTMHALCNVNSEGRGLGHAVRGLSLDLTNLPCFTRLYGDDGAGSADWGSWDDILPLPRYVSAHSRRRRGGTWPVSNRDGYVRNVVELLRKVLGALRCLDRLTICLPAFGYVWDGFDLRAATCIDATHLEQVFDTLRLGLRSPAVSTYLTDLTVELPSTWHVARALEALHEGSNTHSRLEHLRVDITDDTGVSGNLKDLDTSSGFIANENHDGEWEDHGPDGVGHPPSNVQLTWPNRSHQDALWDALTRFKDLRSLAVHATHQLDLPRLTQKLTAAPDGTLTGLSALHLSRVYVTFSSLARLLVPSRIKRVFFDNLIMRHTSSDQHSTRPDTWTDIFDYMRRYCRHLESIDAGDLTYWSTHPLFRPIRVPGVETMLVWSTDDGLADRRAYEQLRRRCRARLKGKNVYPCFDEELDEAGEAALQKGRFEMGQLRKGLDAITN